MYRLFVRHTVADFGKWLDGYHGASPMREAGGVKAQAIYQTADDPNDVTVTHDFETAQAAQAFIDNPDLKTVMKELGVSGPPIAWITQQSS